MNRVNTRSRFVHTSNAADAATVENESQAASTVVFSTAAQNLKKMKNRLAIAQMPDEDAGEYPLFIVVSWRVHVAEMFGA